MKNYKKLLKLIQKQKFVLLSTKEHQKYLRQFMQESKAKNDLGQIITAIKDIKIELHGINSKASSGITQELDS